MLREVAETGEVTRINDLTSATQKLVGRISPQGMKAPWESDTFFAPQFLRAEFGRLLDAMQPGVRMNEALRMYGGYMAAATAAYVGASLATRGEVPTFDISDRTHFYKLRLGDRVVDFLGPFAPLLRAVAGTITETDAQLLVQYGENKLTLLPGFIADLLKGETYEGRKPLSPRGLVETVAPVPIGAGQAVEAIREGESPLTAIPAELSGLRSWPVSDWQRLQDDREKAARSHGFDSWAVMPKGIREQFPELEQKARELNMQLPGERGEYWSEVQRKETELQQKQEAIDKQFPVSEKWRDAYHVLQDKRGEAYEDLATRFPKIIAGFREAQNPLDQALGTYYDAFRENRLPTGELDNERLDAVLADLDAKWTPSQRAYVLEMTGQGVTPRVTEYKQDMQQLRPYWDIADTRWQSYVRGSSRWERYKTWEEAQAASPGVEKTDFGKRVNKVITEAKEAWLKRNRPLEALLIKWEYRQNRVK